MLQDNKINQHIDCVLIGINSAKTLGNCIDSILSSEYPQDKLHIIYVDGGSSDDSVEIAQRYNNVEVISIHPQYPSPGIGRNTGWKAGSSPLVQFLDSDTVLDRQWFMKAVKALGDPQIGAVLGMRQEMHPERSLFNWIGNLEWNGPAGESDCFGGDVLMRRTALEATGGYDEELVGGEDPELSRRIIRAGWQLLRMDASMTHHDLAMFKLSQYLRRAYRSGYGFAAVRYREAAVGSDFWHYEYRKISIKGGGFSAALVISIPLLGMGTVLSSSAALLLLMTGTTLLLMPRLFKVRQFMREQKLSRSDARRYAWHCSFVVLPQLAGVIRFHIGQLVGNPLRNRSNRLATRISDQSI
ncbi:glycosyltransferase [Prosthecochloris vibrioformis]|uniref:Glycosyltransferase n=1 Tax=Prosthecochloris vibrioformis TaxID=1098 RepID=A0A5C4S0G4_PROVB|nr:glycosyltransferase [Prosthecochloris vibrioformis]TNJ37003.1 glycosyltransferase [Prosthecochloris vibrioformis]